jgi:peptide deformylase
MERERLTIALDAFRAELGFGRGIAALQIGIPKRFVAINLGESTHALINPSIMWRNEETFMLWDDCTCFPHLLVMVRRNTSISFSFLDEEGMSQVWERCSKAESELLQHEHYHLDGILATDRVLNLQGIIYREALTRIRSTSRTRWTISFSQRFERLDV